MREVPQLFNKPGFINLTPMVRGPGTKKGAWAPEPRTREAPSDPRQKTHPTLKERGPALVLDSTIKATAERQLQEPPRSAQALSIPPRTPHPTHWGSSASPTLTVQPRGPPRGGRPQSTRKPTTAVPASPHLLLGPLHFPPGLAACRPNSSSLPAASLRTSVITWSSTAPPLHRKHVTSPSRPGSRKKTDVKHINNLTLN